MSAFDLVGLLLGDVALLAGAIAVCAALTCGRGDP